MMSPHHPTDDQPELVPPAELTRLRAALVRPPSPATRARHLAAMSTVARERTSTQVGRLASRSVRGAAAVVATLAITSGLAAAEVLPAPAQRIFSSVSDRLSPGNEAPPATAEDPAPVDDASTPPPGTDEPTGAPSVATTDAEPTAEEPVAAAPKPTTTSTSTTTTRPTVPTTTTTIPGPTEPGSPDPSDPGSTDGGPIDPGTEDGPTDPGTVGRTDVPPSTEAPTEDPVSPAGGSD